MEEREKIIEDLRDDALLFGRVCAPNMFGVKSALFHLELNETYHDNMKRKVNREAPRAHAKSSIVGCVFPLHHIVYDEGQKLVVLISKTQGHSVKLLQTIKDVLEYSVPFRDLYGYWGMHSMKKNTESEIILKDDTMITTRGTGMHIIGLKHINQRPTFVVLDDPEDDNNTRTMEAMDKNLSILLKGIVPGLDPHRGRVWVIGTPQNANCMVEKLKLMKDWDSKTYKAVIDFEKRKVLWPEQRPYEVLMGEKESLEQIGRVSIWYSENQCEIVGDEDQLFKEEDFRYWEGYLETNGLGESFLHITHLNKVKLVKEEVEPVNIFTGADPASSTSNRADYSVTFNIAYTKDGRIFVLPYYRKRVRPTDHANQIIENYKKFRPRYTIPETNGYQEMLRQYLRMKMREGGFVIYGLEQKYSRRQKKIGEGGALEQLETFFRNHLVYIQPGMQELLDELLLYPRMKHDDLLDGFYYATRKLYKPDHSVEVEDNDDDNYLINYYNEESSNWMVA